MKAADQIARQPMDLDRAGTPRGAVHVITERCKECSYCITYCPADMLEYSTDINAKGYHYPIIVEGREDACVLCKFCDAICPEMAIFTSDPSATDES